MASGPPFAFTVYAVTSGLGEKSRCEVFCTAGMPCGESEKGLPTFVIPMPLGLLGC